eukprot:745983-Hanusia_phi.AAC.3
MPEKEPASSMSSTSSSLPERMAQVIGVICGGVSDQDEHGTRHLEVVLLLHHDVACHPTRLPLQQHARYLPVPLHARVMERGAKTRVHGDGAPWVHGEDHVQHL